MAQIVPGCGGQGLCVRFEVLMDQYRTGVRETKQRMRLGFVFQCLGMRSSIRTLWQSNLPTPSMANWTVAGVTKDHGKVFSSRVGLFRMGTVCASPTRPRQMRSIDLQGELATRYWQKGSREGDRVDDGMPSRWISGTALERRSGDDLAGTLEGMRSGAFASGRRHPGQQGGGTVQSSERTRAASTVPGNSTCPGGCLRGCVLAGPKGRVPKIDRRALPARRRSVFIGAGPMAGMQVSVVRCAFLAGRGRRLTAPAL